MSRVLVVEDEEHLALGLRFNLENTGYQVCVARSGPEALAEVDKGGVDVVILDVMLAGPGDGYEVCRAIREKRIYVPIIMLTARDTVADRVRGIEAGADDYVAKPFDLDELIARVRGLLRRQAWTRRNREEEAEDAEPEPEVTDLAFGSSRIDFRTYRAVTAKGEEIRLSTKEAEMMRLFAQREGEPIARGTFLEEVWGEPGTLETRTVDNFVLRLRKYFEPNPKEPRHIISVRGVGYRFVR